MNDRGWAIACTIAAVAVAVKAVLEFASGEVYWPVFGAVVALATAVLAWQHYIAWKADAGAGSE